METVEIIVYLGIAVAIGAIILSFIAHLDPGTLYTSIRNTFTGGGPIQYHKVDATGFTTAAYQLWDQCGLGSEDATVTLYVTGTGSIDRTSMFSIYKKLNFCDTIQSTSESCGNREDVTITPITLPSIVTVTCNSTTHTLDITS